MVLKKLTTNKVGAAGQVSAGTNYLEIIIPRGARLLSVAMINGGNPQQIRADIARVSDNPNDGYLDAIPLFHGLQLYDTAVIWWAGIDIELSDWRKVVGTFFSCTTADTIDMTVAFDE